MPAEIQDVAHRGAAEAVDALGVVADHGEAPAVRLEAEQDGRLQAVGVLVFVDQHMRELGPDPCRKRGLVHHVRPVEQQVVVVEDSLGLLGLDVGGEESPQLFLPFGAPREGMAQGVAERCLGIDRARVDRQAGGLEREALVLARAPARDARGS